MTATVTFEDRQALAARAGLLGVLRDELGATVTEVSRSADGEGSALRHLERNLFEPDATVSVRGVPELSIWPT